MERPEAHEVRRLYSKIDSLGAENQHLKECLSDAADLLATFQASEPKPLTQRQTDIIVSGLAMLTDNGRLSSHVYREIVSVLRALTSQVCVR